MTADCIPKTNVKKNVIATQLPLQVSKTHNAM